MEWLATFPLWVILFLLFWQVVGVGLTLVRAESAVHAAARALARGNSPELAATRIAGGMWGSLDQAEIVGCEVRVTVTLDAPIVLVSVLHGRRIPIERSVVWPAETGGC